MRNILTFASVFVTFFRKIRSVITVPMSIPYTGSSTTEKKVTMSVMRKAFFSMRKRCFKSFISISPSAIFMRIAAIIGNGRY